MGFSDYGHNQTQAGEFNIPIVGFRSKAHRDQVNKKVMKDPQRMLSCLPSVIDMKRCSTAAFPHLLKDN